MPAEIIIVPVVVTQTLTSLCVYACMSVRSVSSMHNLYNTLKTKLLILEILMRVGVI